ncbi:MAG TPA: alkaline phosphatase family protein [Candidatus Binataceae bacterium]|nr:alkaline phosphatase family protein [Candidatus Binataceae bacterium]
MKGRKFLKAKLRSGAAIGAMVLMTASTALAGGSILGDLGGGFPGGGKIRHVLLISIDGMHAVDYANCANGIPGFNGGAPFCPNIAAVGATAINYTAASTSKPSDSFPGLMALVTGGSPRTYGAYYDVAYDRVLAPPTKTTGNGSQAGSCTPNTPNGTTTEYEEGDDIDQTQLNGGAPAGTDGGVASLDPAKLIRDPYNNCAPVYPWNFIRTNTIFGVIHKAGGYTAWSDKHPAYSAVSGPGNGPVNLDDYYAPEINSNAGPLPVTTPLGFNCNNLNVPADDAYTDDFQAIQCYDTLKVNAIVNEIDGLTHNGKSRAKVPAIFGMNFQAMSVGQKLIEKSVGTGGYVDSIGTPSAELLTEIQFVDKSIGEFTSELNKKGLLSSTLIILTAKHGQSPIDPARYDAILNNPGGTTPATILENDGLLAETSANFNGIGPTEDDVSLIWLANSSELATAVADLEAQATDIGLGMLFDGPALAINYNTPGTSTAQIPTSNDPRTPDIIVTPNVGVTYTGSSKKLAEHGGFAHDDTNVIMLVSNPSFKPATITAAVQTAQVAPTILQALGLNPDSLDGVRLEGTEVLPGVPLNGGF